MIECDVVVFVFDWYDVFVEVVVFEGVFGVLLVFVGEVVDVFVVDVFECGDDVGVDVLVLLWV